MAIKGSLKVEVLQAQNLVLRSPPAAAEVVVHLELEDDFHRTDAVRGNNSPTWQNEEHVFTVYSKRSCIRATMIDRRFTSDAGFLGDSQIPISFRENDDMMCNLTDRDGLTMMGQLRLKLSFYPADGESSEQARPEVVQAFRPAILALTADDMNLAKFLMSPALTVDTVFYKSLVGIAAAYNQVPRLIASVVQMEVDVAGTAAPIRPDMFPESRAVKLGVALAREIGLKHLYALISDTVSSIYTKWQGYEIIPQLLGPDEKVDTNSKKVIATVDAMLSTFQSSINTCPSLLRQVCGQFKDMCGIRAPENGYKALATFYFTRYVCAALVAPHAFELTVEPPTPQVQNALSLISLMLHHMAHGTSFPTDSRQSVFNQFLSKNQNRVKEYMDAIVEPLNNATSSASPVKLRDLFGIYKTLTLNMPKFQQIRGGQQFASMLQEISATVPPLNLTAPERVADVQVQKVLGEIVDTELTYVKGLQLLKHGFMFPMQEKFARVGLSKSEFDTMFPTDIHAFNQLHSTRILPLLTRVGDSLSVNEAAAAFQQIVPLVAFYQHYFDSYVDATDMLRDKMKSAKKFAEMLNEIEAALIREHGKADKGSLYFTHLLANPFQRPMRYNLLLKELCKRNCGKENLGDTNHTDVCQVCQASKKMEQMTCALNEKRRMTENKRECLNIVNMFDPRSQDQRVLSQGLPHRQYVHEGEVVTTALSGTNQQPKNSYMFVFSDIVLISSRPAAANDKKKKWSTLKIFNKSDAKSFITMEYMTETVKCKVMDEPGSETDFILAALTSDEPSRANDFVPQYRISVKAEDRQHWTSTLSAQQKRAYEANLRRIGEEDEPAPPGVGEAPRIGKVENTTKLYPRAIALTFWRDPLFEERVEGCEREVVIDAGQQAVIGRQGDIKIMDRTVSRRQCQVYFDPNGNSFMLKDLASVGGTFINAKRVLNFPGHTLEDGDVFFAGKCKFCVRRDYDNPDILYLDFRSGVATGPGGDDEYKSYRISKEQDTFVGRSPQVEASQGVAIKITVGPDSGLSRTHFRISPVGEQGQYLLLDERSRFGTFANPKPVGSEIGYPLNSGDVIQICEAVWVQVQIRFESGPSGPSVGKPAQLASVGANTSVNRRGPVDYGAMIDEWLGGMSGGPGGRMPGGAPAILPGGVVAGGGAGASAPEMESLKRRIAEYNAAAQRQQALLRELHEVELAMQGMARGVHDDAAALRRMGNPAVQAEVDAIMPVALRQDGGEVRAGETTVRDNGAYPGFRMDTNANQTQQPRPVAQQPMDFATYRPGTDPRAFQDENTVRADIRPAPAPDFGTVRNPDAPPALGSTAPSLPERPARPERGSVTQPGGAPSPGSAPPIPERPMAAGRRPTNSPAKK